jgi:hypothetical protein
MFTAQSEMALRARRGNHTITNRINNTQLSQRVCFDE